MASKQKRVELTVQAEDTYNPADYIQVHHKFFEGMRNAMRAAHGPDCVCIYCGRDERPPQETSPAPADPDEETPCPKREDGIHCECWYGGSPCCGCGVSDTLDWREKAPCSAANR